jgi:hypothetical protein
MHEMDNMFVNQTLRMSIGLIAMAFGAQVAAELVLYEGDDFSGRSQRFYAQQNDLGNVRFNDKASSVVVRSGNWQLCDDNDFRGQCISLNPGSYPSLRDLGINRRVSSVRPITSGSGSGSWGGGWGGSNAAVELFEHNDYAGRSLASNGHPDLSEKGFNDKASSVIIRSGRWEFCTDADYRGRCTTLGPGSYRDMGQQGLNDQISSFRMSGGNAGYGNARPNSNGWNGDDGSAPEVHPGIKGTGSVSFNNGCVVFFNAEGQRFQNLPACHGQQIRRAESAMANYRTEQGLNRTDDEHPWAGSQSGGNGNYNGAPPEIIMGTNGEGEVIFRNNCVAYYNAQGRRYRQQPSCNPTLIRQADAAMASYRREQGM